MKLTFTFLSLMILLYLLCILSSEFGYPNATASRTECPLYRLLDVKMTFPEDIFDICIRQARTIGTTNDLPHSIQSVIQESYGLLRRAGKESDGWLP